ncbi:MAG: formyl transferase [Roseburia sp.]|nr:formyl transferase [Roseburia sp.]MCM1098158.1 formyl transferase [Ruminococcus flavefaciens]
MKRIMLLSNNANAEALFNWLEKKGYEVSLFHDPLTLEILDQYKPEFVISYNYRYLVKEEVIGRLGNRIINLHTSYLPWNKGSSPNLWSFIDDTPKGVTIHRLEKGLDKGKIIVQKECRFDEDTETLASTYAKLNAEIVQLLKDNWDRIISGEYELKEAEGAGSYHRTADLEALLGGRKIDYSMTVSEFKKFLKQR